jgi:hypothetical protein
MGWGEGIWRGRGDDPFLKGVEKQEISGIGLRRGKRAEMTQRKSAKKEKNAIKQKPRKGERIEWPPKRTGKEMGHFILFPA